jgi:hypothetical protein
MSISNDLTPSIVNITVPQGSDVKEFFQLYTDAEQTTAFDLSGFTAESHVRANYNSSTPLLTLTSDNNKIILGAEIVDGEIVEGDLTNGGIALIYNSTDTSAIRFSDEALEAVRDIELIDGLGKIRRIIQGTITFTREVTR